MKKNVTYLVIVLLAITMIYFNERKVGYHEDEVYTFSSSVNDQNGLMSAYEDNRFDTPLEWKSREYIKDYFTLKNENIFNLKSVYINQAMDNHPPLYYLFVHFASLIAGRTLNKYAAFLVNISFFIMSLYIINKLLKLIGKEHLYISTIILYGLSIGTISMVIFERMYMQLSFFILLYLYLNIKLYKNDFLIDKNTKIYLGLSTIMGFLTQYFFAVYAFGIFLVMVIKMIKLKNYSSLKEYIKLHFFYAIIAIILFIPSIYHLLFTDRGISNLSNTNFISKLLKYINYIIYGFSINYIVLIILLGLILYYIYKKKEDRFIMILLLVPTIIFLLVTAKFTSFQNLRYITPTFIFISLMIILLLDNIKYKSVIIVLCMFISIYGLIVSNPKYLYEGYREYLNIANENSDKLYVFVYDNIFNHMKNIPEMMIYKESLIVNKNKDELKNIVNDNKLNNEKEYVLSISSYLDNEEILNYIKDNSEFKNSKLLIYSDYNSDDVLTETNLYLMSK